VCVGARVRVDRPRAVPAAVLDRDRDRDRGAGIPGDIEFATKPWQAQAMISRAIEAGPFAWFTTCWPGLPGLDASPEVVEGDAVVERGAVNDLAVSELHEQTILPIWHGITKAEVMAASPSLSDKIARSTADFTIEEIAAEIADVVRPIPMTVP
jgi:hypothetical protein